MKVKQIIIYTLGDIHAAVERTRIPHILEVAPNVRVPLRGGLRAALSSLCLLARSRQRAISESAVIVLHNGDLLGETGLWGNLDRGVSAASLLRLAIQSVLGDVPIISTIGNHDAKFGFAPLDELVTRLHPTVNCVNLHWSGREYLGIEHSIDIGGTRVVVVGLTDRSIGVHISNSTFKSRLQLTADVPRDYTPLSEYFQKLNAKRCDGSIDLILVNAHLAHRDLLASPIFAHADFVLGGHDHLFYPQLSEEAPAAALPMLDCGSSGFSFGEAIFSMEPNQTPELTSLRLLPVPGNPEEELPEVTAQYAAWLSSHGDMDRIAQNSRHIGWVDETISVPTHSTSPLYLYEHPIGRLYSAILVEFGRQIVPKSSSFQMIGGITSGHFRGQYLYGAADLADSFPVRYTPDNAIKEWELRDCAPDANTLVLARIEWDHWPRIFAASLFGRGTRLLHFCGCVLVQIPSGDLQWVFSGSPEDELWLATTSYVVKPHTPEQSILGLSEGVTEVVATELLVSDCAVGYFQAQSLERQQPIRVPAEVISPQLYDRLRRLGRDVCERIPVVWRNP